MAFYLILYISFPLSLHSEWLTQISYIFHFVNRKEISKEHVTEWNVKDSILV
jgi:hypothetical protein